jgi:hypothetical protein
MFHGRLVSSTYFSTVASAIVRRVGAPQQRVAKFG